MTIATVESPFTGLRVIDADSHYSEPYDLWTSRAPAAYKDRVLRVLPNEALGGRAYWFLGDEPIFPGGGASFVDREGRKKTVSGMITEGDAWEDIHEASYDVDARLQLLDELGIWAQVVYPNTIGFGAYALLQSTDQELARLVVEIYNDACAEWQEAGRGRLYPQAVLPFWDIPASVREAQRIHAMGLRGITMAGMPHLGGLPDLGQPEWEPLYEVLQDLALPINIHVGATNVAHDDANGPVAWPSLGDRAVKPVNSVQMELANARFLSNLVVSDVLLKYPDLKWVSVESGVGWIPYVLERIDYEYREDIPGRPPPDRPSALEMFKRNIYGCFWFEYAGPTKLLDYLGVDNVMWESDFPHPTCLYPSPLERTAEALAELDPVSIRKVMQDNAAKLYRIDVAP
ncbi:MAG: amidohydrolase family protein [Acidimicrobiia bacterium]